MEDFRELGEARDALELSAEDLYESAPCGYLSTSPAGHFLKVNKTFLYWTGFSREELIQKKRFQDILTVPGKIYHDTHFAPLLQMQGSVSEVAFDIVKADGKILPVLVNAVDVKTSSGLPLLRRAMVFNATDRRAYERELLAARRKAEDTARSKSDLLNWISHDIRNLLTGILGATKRLQTGTMPPEQQKRYLDLLRASAENMMLLASNLLEVSRLEGGKMALQRREFALHDLLEAAVSPIVATAETKGLELRRNVDEQISSRLIGDDIKLGQVLGNLLANAVKFTDRGFVEISVRLVAREGNRLKLRFAVRDTGIGIDEKHISSLTDAFSRASVEVGSQYGGTGLGLSLSQKILDLHGSRLEIESRHGEGSVFSFAVELEAVA